VEINPIAGIRAARSAALPRDELEVQPPFALDRPGRLGDDAYSGTRDETERGLEEDSDVGEETSDSASDAESRVNFFA
jgi:hypothetical protein